MGVVISIWWATQTLLYYSTVYMKPTMTSVQDTVDTAIATTASKVTIAGSAGTLLGWVTSSSFGMWMGILIGLTGLAVNWYFKLKTNRRHEEAHEAYMRRMRYSENVEKPQKDSELDE